MESQDPSNADQPTTTDSTSSQGLFSQYVENADKIDSPYPSSTDESTDTDSSLAERHIFRGFAITPNNSLEVRLEVFFFLETVHTSGMAASERFLGTYLGVVRGRNGGPDQVVMVETVREGDGRSEDAEAELEGIPFDQRKYFDSYWGLVRSLISLGLLERGGLIDSSSEEGIELQKRLRERNLSMCGVCL